MKSLIFSRALMAFSLTFLLGLSNTESKAQACFTCTPPCVDWEVENFDLQCCPSFELEFVYLNCPNETVPFPAMGPSTPVNPGCRSCDGGCECPIGVNFAGEFIDLNGSYIQSFPVTLDCYEYPDCSTGDPSDPPGPGTICAGGWKVTIDKPSGKLTFQCL